MFGGTRKLKVICAAVDLDTSCIHAKCITTCINLLTASVMCEINYRKNAIINY
jgi:hypothetical protein